MDTLTQTHLVTLRNLLAYRLRDLQAELAGESNASKMPADVSREVQDRKDVAAQEQSTTIGDAEAARDADELAAVEAALQRLDENRYGECLDCGESIPLQRLLVQPAATRCAACQSVLETAAQQRLAR
jgi:RNA polymerase-binding protein DksA